MDSNDVHVEESFTLVFQPIDEHPTPETEQSFHEEAEEEAVPLAVEKVGYDKIRFV